MRVTPAQLDELLHPIVDPKAEKDAQAARQGPAGRPGGASGQVVFTAADAVAWAKQGKKVILVREETNPEDVEGMRAAAGHPDGPRRHDQPRGAGGPRLGQVLHRRRRRTRDRRPRQDTSPSAASAINEGDWITPQRHQGHRLPRASCPMVAAPRQPVLHAVHEDLRRRPQAGRPRQRRHPGGRRQGPRSSAPRASGCSAPSTCSTARAPRSRSSSCAR